ncbi:MAG: MnmC family methyltransferase [Prochloraceae cyanobacterium]|nr:MnmC family methyltransferase [Prochloraceae cyanobacterium]
MSFEPKLTEDGSFTFFNHELGEAFHSRAGAKLEAAQKFVKPCNIAEKARVNSRLCLLDICYGLGYNSAAALTTIQSINPECCVELIALEIDLRVPRQAVEGQLLNGWPQTICRSLTALAESGEIKTPQLQGKLLLGDARKTIQQVLNSPFRADAIFLDPFSPPKCPQLWTVEFLQLVAMCLAPTGRLATYSCAAPVRAAIGLTGLKFGSTSRIGRRSPGTVAGKVATEIPPLSQQELEHLNTRAAVPYRDPQLKDSPQLICQRRFAEQQASYLEPTTRWKKRWSDYHDSK